MSEPNIDGKINFNNVAFNATPLNNVFRIDKESIAVINNKGIEFNKFTIRDTTNNAITIAGAVNTTDFLNYSFNVKINADNFQAINSTKKNNKLFYGKWFFPQPLQLQATRHTLLLMEI